MSRVNSYTIDTNIINYILDGKLWARQPVSLMRARPEPVVAYRQAGENFETTEKFYPSLHLSKLAHQWCVTQRPRLFVSPTVHTEMMQAPQFSDGLWLDCPGEEWSGLGLVESLDKRYIIDDPTMDKFMSRLPVAIQQLEPTPLKGKREDYLVALNACLGSDALPRFAADLRIYLEACKIAHHSAGTMTFLITQDYKFFKTFIRSVDVEECLGRLWASPLL